MGEFVKYAVIGIILALAIGYFLGQSQESRDFETRIMVIDENTKKHIKIDEIKTYPKMSISKDENISGTGNLYFYTPSKTTAFIKVKAKGYKTKTVFRFMNANEITYIEMIKQGGKKATDAVIEEEEIELELKEEPKIELKPNV